MNKKSPAITTKIIHQWDQDLFFKILDTIHDVILIIDSDTTIVYANQAYAEMLGIPVHKVIGRRLDVIEPNAHASEVIKTGVPISGPDYLDSLGIEVIGNACPLIENGRIIGSVATFKNISREVALNKELERSKEVVGYLQEQLNQYEPLPASFKEYIGQNPQLRKTLAVAAKVAKTNSTVLIRGESGVGKEVLARAIHNSSKRKENTLIKVNCAAIPEHLLESELFGYEEGAFTGAKKGGKLGKFELAHGGTIFLDEIGDMSLAMQAKLLRVLQEKELERVGGNKTLKLDIRVIAATNRDLEKMLAEGTFRKDLYYRLNIVPLFILPLSERKDDIVLLVDRFLDQFSAEAGEKITISSEAMRVLQNYDWPGNVRELQNFIEHACILRDGPQIEARNLPQHLRTQSGDCVVVQDEAEEHKSHEFKDAIEKVERDLMQAALEKNRNNRSAAIKELGISRRAFYEKLHKYKLDDYLCVNNP